MGSSKDDDTPSRREQILGALAQMLEEAPGRRITTAGLARQVGVSEAALYRHFASKAKMFEGLIEFIEDTIFSRISRILVEPLSTEQKCERTLLLLLTFTQRNPGITRILTGDPLAGETERLRLRVSQLFDRIETQLRQILRESTLHDEPAMAGDDVAPRANLMLAAVEGRISQYVRSDFSRNPMAGWPEQWQMLAAACFEHSPAGHAG